MRIDTWHGARALFALALLIGSLLGPGGPTWASRAGIELAQGSGTNVEIVSGGLSYPSYLAAPADPTPKPATVLIHSFNGLEPGYIALSDRLAEEGYVVLALGWQAHERQPSDATVEQLVRDAVAFLRARSDVDPDRLGLTGFCAGGRYTILLLPLIKEFKAGIAWYGFPYTGGTPGQPTRPADLIEGLSAPILVSHSTEDRPSPIEGISRYTQALAAAGKSFKLKVYEGEPHGFMLQGGQLAQTANARDAYAAMVDFFNRTLKST